jgi:hypothetical protein
LIMLLHLVDRNAFETSLFGVSCQAISSNISSVTYLGQLEAMTTSEEHTSMDSMHVPTSHELETTLKTAMLSRPHCLE